jgi:uncharacterized membrane protein YdcZ (DUF606 family)
MDRHKAAKPLFVCKLFDFYQSSCDFMFKIVIVKKVLSVETLLEASWWVWLGEIFSAMFVAGAIMLIT